MSTSVHIIRIPSDLKGRLDPNHYQCIKGTEHENILCAALVAMGNVGISLTATNFLHIYIWFVQTLYAGIEVDLRLHPRLKDSRLLEAARGMKEQEDSTLLSRETILKIADFISGGDWGFREALSAEIGVWEAKLLLSQFSPAAVELQAVG